MSSNPGGGLKQVGVSLTAQNATGFTNAIGQAEKAVGGFTGVLGGAGAALSNASVKAIAFGTALGNMITQGVNWAIAKVKEMSAELVNWGMQALQASGRVEQLRQIAIMMGGKAGYTADQVDDMAKSIRKSGIEAETAYNEIILFNRFGLDMAETSKMARVAQNAAVIGLTNSSDALQRIIWGITTHNSLILNGIGLQVNFTDANAKYAAKLKKSTANLTEAERTQAAYNAVIEAGIPIEGAYEASMKSASKQLGSYQRIQNDLLVAIGAPFQEAYYLYAKGVNDVTTAWGKAFDEGGKFYKVMQLLGATSSVVFEGFTGAVKKGTDSVIESLGNMLNSMFGITEAAPEWVDTLTIGWGDAFKNITTNVIDPFSGKMTTYGEGWVINLATGIMNAAATVLTTAMNYLTSILTWWLAPGSPPKVAPHIDEWGQATVTEWLKGFTKVDFGALSSLQSSFAGALSGLVAGGLLDKSQEGKLYTSLSKGLMQALGGKDVPGFLESIKSSLGIYGVEVADLAGKQLELHAATVAVTAAEKALDDQRKKEVAATEDRIKLTDEYNQLLDAGASPEVLAAKRAQVNIAKAAAKAAQTEGAALEKSIVTQKENVTVLQDKVSLQEELVRQLLGLGGKNIVTPENAAAGAGKGAETPALPGGAGGVSGAISTALDRLKKQITDKFAEIFKPVTDSWNTLIETVGGAWKKIQAIYEAEGIGGVVAAIWRWVTDPDGGVIATTAGMIGAWLTAIGVQLGIEQPGFTGIMAALFTWTGKFWEWLNVTVIPAVAVEMGKFTTAISEWARNPTTQESLRAGGYDVGYGFVLGVFGLVRDLRTADEVGDSILVMLWNAGENISEAVISIGIGIGVGLVAGIFQALLNAFPGWSRPALLDLLNGNVPKTGTPATGGRGSGAGGSNPGSGGRSGSGSGKSAGDEYEKPKDIFGFAAGGSYRKGRPFIAGEKGPEIIIPDAAGMVLPNSFLQRVQVAVPGLASLGAGGGSGNVTKNYNLSYQTVQSSQSVASDIRLLQMLAG